jgi:hypothetical protein
MSEPNPNRSSASSLDAGTCARFAARLAAIVLPPLFVVSALFAAPKQPAPPPKKPPIKWTPKPKGDAGASDADAKPEAGPKEAKADAKVLGTSNDPNAVEVKESEKKEGDATVKVFEFGETEIEGRSRWPAVTYFIRRMRAEFEASKLPHRSFLPELGASKGDPAVK